MDDLMLLLQAQLEMQKTKDNINAQIKTLNGNLDKLNLKINFDDTILKNLNDQIKEITKDLAKSNNATVKIDTTELEKAKEMFKDVEGELISFKEKISYDKEGNKITRLISQFKMLDGTIKTVTKNASGKLLGEAYSKDLQKVQNEREKALQQEQKTRQKLEQQEEKIRQKRVQQEEKNRLKLAQQEEKIRQKRAQQEQKLAEQQMKNQSQLLSQQQKTLAQMQKQYQTTLNLFNSLKNDSRNLFKADGKNSLESYINQLANIKSQLSDMQKGKLSIADSKTTQEMQKQLNIMEQEFNRQKSLIALDEQKEKIQRRINDLLRQIESVRLKTTDEGQLAQLSQLENSIKNIKLTSTDATVQLDRFQAELKEIKFDSSKTKALEDLMFRIEEFKSTTNSKLQKLFDTGKIDSSQLENFKNKLNEISTNSPNAEKQMVRLRNEINNVARNANTGATGIQKFVKTVLQLAGIGSMYMVMQKMVNVTKELTLNVMELDSAMISLQRVSSGTATTYEDFKNNMFGIADAVGSTATDMIRSAKEFAQLGYSLEEAGILAENASKLATAGEMSIDQATKNITASLTAFNMEIEESGRLIDVYNRIGK